MRTTTAIALCTTLLASSAALAGDVVLNEWNAVGSEKWLGNPGSAVAGCPNPNGPAGVGCSENDDSFFGRVQGNGGDWIELVVVKDHTDMRGWKLQWIEAAATDADGTDIWYGDGSTPQGQIIFSNSAVWADLRVGTIITITEHSTLNGGLDSDTSFDPCTGDWWINANCFDAALVSCDANVFDAQNPTYNDPMDVGNDNWAARLLKADDTIVQNMTGEGQASWGGTGVNSREGVELAATPTQSTSPFSAYKGEDNSSFGQPNSWKDAVTQCRLYQDFGAMRAAVRAQLCPTCNPIMLNEYNAVSATGYLGGGTQAADAAGGQAADAQFGRVLGNGGNWLELVVIADNLDMRGWTLRWQDSTASGVIQLSNASFWGTLRSGTILTLVQRTTALGGLDTDLSYSPGTGDRWVNVNTFDISLVTQTTSTKPGHISGEFSTSNDDWSLQILDQNSQVQMTRQGEGSPYYFQGNVGTTDICRLRQDPSGRVDAASAFDDGNTSSTFGRPNTWTLCPSGTTVTQDFAALPEQGCTWTAPNPADLNGDGHVDGADLGILLGSWGQSGVAADINHDGHVDGADLGVLLGSWG